MRNLAVVLFTVALALLAWSGLRSLMDNYKPERHSGVLVVPFPERPPDVVQSENAKFRQRRALEIVDGYFEAETRRFRGIRFSVDQTEPIAREFDGLVGGILDDERGRQIAGSARRLEQFLEIFEWRHPTAEEVRRLEQDADLLVADVRRAYPNAYDTRVPPTELTERLEAMLAEAESRHRLYGQSLATLRYVVRQARRRWAEVRCDPAEGDRSIPRGSGQPYLSPVRRGQAVTCPRSEGENHRGSAPSRMRYPLGARRYVRFK